MNTPRLPALSSSSHAESPVPPAHKAFQTALHSAKRVLKRRLRVLLLVRDAYAQMTEHAHPIEGVREDLGALVRLVRAWALRHYERIPWTPLLLATGAIVYFVMPADLMPDVLVGIGFVDDVAVVSAVVRAVRNELDRFRAWEEMSHQS